MHLFSPNPFLAVYGKPNHGQKMIGIVRSGSMCLIEHVRRLRGSTKSVQQRYTMHLYDPGPSWLVAYDDNGRSEAFGLERSS